MISMEEYADLGLTEEDIKKLNICFLGTKKTPSKLVTPSKKYVVTTPTCGVLQKDRRLDVDEWSDSSSDFDDSNQISTHSAISSSLAGGDRGFIGGCGRGNFLYNNLEKGSDYGSHVPSYVHFRRMERELRPLFNMVDSAQFRNDTIEQYFAEQTIKSPSRELNSPSKQNMQNLKEIHETNSSNAEKEAQSPEQTLFRKKSNPYLKVKSDDTNGCLLLKEQVGTIDNGKPSCDKRAAKPDSFKSVLVSANCEKDESTQSALKESKFELYIPPAMRKRNGVNDGGHVGVKPEPDLDSVPPNDCPASQTKTVSSSKKSSMTELCKRNAFLNSLRRQREEIDAYSSRSNVISSLETGLSQQESTSLLSTGSSYARTSGSSSSSLLNEKECFSSPRPVSDISEHHLASSLLYCPEENKQYFASSHSFDVVERVTHPTCLSPDCLIPAEGLGILEEEDGSECFYYYDPDTEAMVKYRIPGSEIVNSSQPLTLTSSAEDRRRKNANTWETSYFNKKDDFEFEAEEFPPLQ